MGILVRLPGCCVCRRPQSPEGANIFKVNPCKSWPQTKWPNPLFQSELALKILPCRRATRNFLSMIWINAPAPGDPTPRGHQRRGHCGCHPATAPRRHSAHSEGILQTPGGARGCPTLRSADLYQDFVRDNSGGCGGGEQCLANIITVHSSSSHSNTLRPSTGWMDRSMDRWMDLMDGWILSHWIH